MERIVKSNEEWRERLTREQYRVSHKGHTEPAFSGEYDDHWEKGVYLCVCCGLELFDSAAKLHSGSGWPSFTAPFSEEHIATRPDHRLATPPRRSALPPLRRPPGPRLRRRPPARRQALLHQLGGASVPRAP